MKDPPLLTGRIDGWIGYGSEPNKSIDGKKTSFNKKRATIIEKVTVHEAVKGEDGSREQEVEIYYRFIGKID